MFREKYRKIPVLRKGKAGIIPRGFGIDNSIPN
jgi:hypothetical protein